MYKISLRVTIICGLCVVISSSSNLSKNLQNVFKSSDKIDNVTLNSVDIIAINNPKDTKFESSASTEHISESEISRFRGTSVGDFLSGIAGVYNGDGRNSGALDVNIRGMQGQGRVPVIIDGASNETTIYQGYNGANSRSYLDPDFIGSVDIQKGAYNGADAVGASGGVVRMKTIGAKDIIPQGQNFGVRIKGDFATNSTHKTPVGTRAGWVMNDYEINEITDATINKNPNASQFYPARGIKRQHKFDSLGRNGSVALGYANEYFELVAAYAVRKNGNYYAGKRGAGADYKIGKYKYSAKPQYQNAHITPYRAGEEVLNTSQDNHSVLLKTKAKFDAHSLEIGYNAYRSRYGNIVGMLTQNNIHQHELSTIDIDTYTAQYAYDPENPYVNLKANAFTLRAHNRMNVLNIDQGDNPDWDLQDKIEQNPNLNYPKEWLQIISYGASYVRSGVNLSNLSQISPNLSFEYGAGYSYDKTGAPRKKIPNNWNEDPNFASNGKRKEFNLFSNLGYYFGPKVKLDASVRYQNSHTMDFRASNPKNKKEKFTLKDKNQGFSTNLTLSVFLNDELTMYAKFVRILRNPSLFEATTPPISIVPLQDTPLFGEKARNLELGAGYLANGIFKKSDKFGFHAAIFDNYIKDYITRAQVWTQDDTSHGQKYVASGRVNLDYARMRGAEISLSYDARVWFGEISYNRMFSTMFCRKNDDKSAISNDSPLCGRGGVASSYALQHIPPKDQLTLNFGARMLDEKLLFGARVIHVGKPVAKENYKALGASKIWETNWKPYSTLDFYASYKISPNAQLNLSLDNVGDKYYVDALSAGPIPAPGRNVRVGFSAKF